MLELIAAYMIPEVALERSVLATQADFWSGRFTEIGELAVAAAIAATAWATLERVRGGPRVR